MSDDDLRNVDLLIKIMQMTQSDNDNVALVAMRRANAMLLKEGKDWDDVLRGRIKITIVEDPFKNISVPQHHNSTGATYRPSAQPSTPPPPPRPDPVEIRRKQREAELRAEQMRAAEQRQRAAEQRQREADARAAAAAARHGERPNRYEGTCVHCANKVGISDGIAFHNGIMWKVKHRPGECPKPQPGRRRRGAFTVDDLAV